MAQGILGVEPLGPDKYQVQLANGTSPILTGAAGQNAYDQYRREQSAMGPGALAAGPKPTNAYATDALPPGPPSSSEATGASPARIKSLVGELVGTRPGAAPAPQQPAPQAPPTGPSYLPYAGKGIDPATGKEVSGRMVQMPDGSMWVDRGPGTKGSPGGITKLGKEVLDSRAAADAAATPHEQAAAAAQAEGVRLGIEQNEKEKAFLEQRKQGAMNEVAAQQQEADDQASFATEMRAREEKARDEYYASRPPEETQQQSAMATIAGALGAFGASLGKTPNFAAELVQQIRNNKMRKWEAEVALKGDKANNLLAKYHAATGDMKLAKAAVKETLDKQYAIEAQQMSLSTKSEQMANTYKQVAAAAQGNAIRSAQESDEAKKLAFYGNKMLNAPAVAGTRGGLAPATQGAYGTAQSQTIDIEANRRADAKAAVDSAKAAQDAKAGGPQSEKEKSYEQTAGAVYRKAVAAVRAAGGSVDKDGNIVGDISLPRDLPGGDSGETAATKASFTELGSMYANMNNAGAEAGQPTKEALTPKLGTFSNEAAKAQLQGILKGSVDALKALDAKRGVPQK